MAETIVHSEGDSKCADAPIPTRARRGATVMEYVLILSLIVSVCLAGLGYLGQSNNTINSGVSDSLNETMNKGNGNGNGYGKGKGKGNGKS
jgi:Flp pilus assembly pilin Flp